MPKSPEDPRGDALAPVLRDVEEELKRRLHEACEAEARGVSTASAEEVRRLEDSLLHGAVAAEQALTLRRHIANRQREFETGTRTPHDEGHMATPNEPEVPAVRMREFRDADGQLWRAWPVIPGQARPGRTAERYLGEFHKGWICFEALESAARRRLPQQPGGWAELPESELVRLLGQAISAPERKTQRRATDASHPTRLH